MRVLYLHQYFVAPDRAGGTRSYELARRLVAKGHEVTLVTSSALMPEHGGGRVETEIDGIRLVVLPVPYRSEMSYARRTASFAEFAARASRTAMSCPCDVVYASSTPLTVALPGLAASRRQRVPLVFEVRDLWPDLPIAMGALRNPLLRGAAQLLERVAYRGSAEVVALSPGMARSIAQRGVSERQITVIPNGCDIEAFEVDRGDAEAYVRRMFPGEGPLVVYAGSLGAINDAGWLVDVAEQMQHVNPRVRFAWVGGGPDHGRVLERARASGLLDRSLFLRPPIPKREVPLLLGGADLATSLFLPLEEMQNNSANKFFDALASGLPVAINYGGWQADLLRDSGAGLVLERSDPGASARAIAAALSDAQWRRTASAAARGLARARFDRDALADQLAAVLQRAAA